MSDEIITRQQMADMMEASFGASVEERLGHNWRRMNTVVADQGECEPEGTLGFHMVELFLDGCLEIRSEYQMETTDRALCVARPQALTYQQSFALVRLSCTGQAKIQQIYIDDAVIRETAASMLKGDPDKVTLLGFQGIYDATMKRVALDILHEARFPSAGGDLMADNLAQNLAILLLRRNAGDTIREPFRGRLSNDEMAQIACFLEDHIEDTGGLDTLAGLVGMDVFSFTRAFKATTGETAHRFLIERRIARACDRLRASDESIAEIAYACGFSSQAHMTSTFTKHLGIAPGAYRREVRG